jgi:hypothetical protein
LAHRRAEDKKQAVIIPPPTPNTTGSWDDVDHEASHAVKRRAPAIDNDNRRPLIPPTMPAPTATSIAARGPDIAQRTNTQVPPYQTGAETICGPRSRYPGTYHQENSQATTTRYRAPAIRIEVPVLSTFKGQLLTLAIDG